MAIISSASGQSTGSLQDTARGRTNVKTAQALAKMKALEKKAKKYSLPMGELAIFTQ